MVGLLQQALTDVKDPEIPALSIVELGMVNHVTFADGKATVELTPTFLGCPALSIIQHQVERRLAQVDGVSSVEVKFVFHPPWTTERISAEGREKLRDFGIAPPPCALAAGRMEKPKCPYCGSDQTRLENLFGPTACRSLYYCEQCRQPFEAMKPV
ncbi:MAG: phenylacetate-CoA oxygenase subunit PaaJ [Alicyclobacillus herbarius]|uniref:1,2-phenylacetyl-CoA epoxidase subunit PaaD n=1 Tax=Alicyclobacillus herbarius TaxID=122960 RepID=UPI000478E6A7|nr:1,2-phenylacetyl-CoA epoxidase subunit PaaD [Alicyclobacillus herbarius]MCL6631004.1 phenylacetate-CoA oxygenase subunit PaaJ [Alicyclobacillus herbarius]